MRWQVGLSLAGIAAWIAGAALGEPFVAGFGVGVLAAGLAVRVLRERTAPPGRAAADRD
ncbi:MAG: hypothetical protein RRA92_02200 [Gemmatimonadota bacterium]|nr:hypothetical protein [Gemmatimonadota bacterium]